MVKVRVALMLVISVLIAGNASAQTWQALDPTTSGWSPDRLEAAKRQSSALKSTAVMIVQDGRVIASWGDTSHKVNVASVRKSLLSALYGIAVSEGRIDLSSSLADLGIDDNAPSLTATEKTATVRDLLMARSGVYHPAAFETGDIKRKQIGRAHV